MISFDAAVRNNGCRWVPAHNTPGVAGWVYYSRTARFGPGDTRQAEFYNPVAPGNDREEMALAVCEEAKRIVADFLLKHGYGKK